MVKGPGDRRTGYKPTKAETKARVLEIYKLLVAGIARHDISRYVSEKTNWAVSERTLDRYCQQAAHLFETQAVTVREEELGKAIARLNDLYARTYRIQDFKTALAVQKEINELIGLYAAGRRRAGEAEDDESRPIAILMAPPRATSREQWQQDVLQREQRLLAPPQPTP